MTPELRFALDLATEAGKIAMSYFGQGVTVKTKHDASPVTEADETINQLVIDACRRRYPDYGVLGEENSWHADRSWKWVCDPIDGTADFVKGKPDFMFALSLDHDGQPVLAVTVHPVSGDTYYATKGGGAFLNDDPITVSRRPLDEATLVLPTSPSVLADHADMYQALTDASRSIVHVHSSVYKGMKIADGTFDGAVWPGNVHPWDVNAVELIVSEAGGVVSDKHGKAYERYDTDLQAGLIVSNQRLHESLIVGTDRAD